MTLRVATGCMFSGKTDWLLQHWHTQPAGTALLLKPLVDNRVADDVVRSRTGHCATATHQPASLEGDGWMLCGAQTKAVFVDEGQFLSGLAHACRHWLALGLDVWVAGLDLKFDAQPFLPMQAVLEMEGAHITHLAAKCNRCGGQARFSKRVGGSLEDIVVGNCYVPLCARCFEAEQLAPEALTP